METLPCDIWFEIALAVVNNAAKFAEVELYFIKINNSAKDSFEQSFYNLYKKIMSLFLLPFAGICHSSRSILYGNDENDNRRKLISAALTKGLSKLHISMNDNNELSPLKTLCNSEYLVMDSAAVTDFKLLNPKEFIKGFVRNIVISYECREGYDKNIKFSYLFSSGPTSKIMKNIFWIDISFVEVEEIEDEDGDGDMSLSLEMYYRVLVGGGNFRPTKNIKSIFQNIFEDFKGRIWNSAHGIDINKGRAAEIIHEVLYSCEYSCKIPLIEQGNG